MSAERRLTNPWLIAVWPGMGHVAVSAGYYLMAKLDMHLLAEVPCQELFDVNQVEIRQGLIQATRLPRSRIFVWEDPRHQHDLLVFLGEAQPPLGKYQFCRRLMQFAQKMEVERVFTFAAMATDMHPQHRARVFCTATNEDLLKEVLPHHAEVLKEGTIGGLNGVLLAVAAETGIPGACLLGEMPHIFAHLPFPAASFAVLEVFREIAGIDVDLLEIKEQADLMNRQLGEVLAHVEQSIEGEAVGTDEQAEFAQQNEAEDQLSETDRLRIEKLFDDAGLDRSKAFELKQLLDRLGVFKEFEDQFLDLFKKPKASGDESSH